MMGTCRKATCGFAAGGLVFVVSACGDSSTSSGTTSPSPTPTLGGGGTSTPTISRSTCRFAASSGDTIHRVAYMARGMANGDF
jgi:hypothetical protein